MSDDDFREQLRLLEHAGDPGQVGKPAGTQRYSDLLLTKHGEPDPRLARCREVLGTYGPGSSFHAVSAGDWNFEHVLAWALDHVPEGELPEVRIATWTVATETSSHVIDAHRAGLFKRLRLMTHWHARTLYAKEASLPRECIATADLHAKAILITTPSWHITVLTSANFTANPRIETYTVLHHEQAHTLHCGWFDELYEGSDT